MIWNLLSDGDGWMSGSKLQYYVSQQLSIHFGQHVIRENMRPNWLNTGNGGNLELDFFIEELNLAIEVQGEQHWMFIPFFHGDKDGYNRQVGYDSYKRDICLSKGIRFVEVFSRGEIDDLIQEFLISENGLVEVESECVKKRDEGIIAKKREEIEKLHRELVRVNRGIAKLEKRMRDGDKEKLIYATRRMKNILQELDGTS